MSQPVWLYVPMVRFAQQNAIIYTGLTTINPMLPVVRLAHSRGPIATRENTTAIPGDQRSTDGEWDGAHGPSDVEWFGFPTHNDRDDFRVTRPPPGFGCADVGAVVQGRDPEAGA